MAVCYLRWSSFVPLADGRCPNRIYEPLPEGPLDERDYSTGCFRRPSVVLAADPQPLPPALARRPARCTLETECWIPCLQMHVRATSSAVTSSLELGVLSDLPEASHVALDVAWEALVYHIVRVSLSRPWSLRGLGRETERYLHVAVASISSSCGRRHYDFISTVFPFQPLPDPPVSKEPEASLCSLWRRLLSDVPSSSILFAHRRWSRTGLWLAAAADLVCARSPMEG